MKSARSRGVTPAPVGTRVLEPGAAGSGPLRVLSLAPAPLPDWWQAGGKLDWWRAGLVASWLGRLRETCNAGPAWPVGLVGGAAARSGPSYCGSGRPSCSTGAVVGATRQLRAARLRRVPLRWAHWRTVPGSPGRSLRRGLARRTPRGPRSDAWPQSGPPSPWPMRSARLAQ